MYLKSGGSKVKKNSAINSAALQDHIMRKFNFNLEQKVSTGGFSAPPARRKTHQKLPSITRGIDNEIKKLQQAQKKSILPFEDQTLKRLKQTKEDEIKMSKYTKALTLAQKLGLVEAPPLPLNAQDWLAIEQKSRARNDSQNCCSICLQDFKIQPQTLLSCSHVFHEKCLSSYERHNKVRCCPICRRRDYEKKAIDQALKMFTMKCILRIQRVYRGSRTRIKLYTKLVDTKYETKSMLFKRRLIGFKMWRISQKIERNVKLQGQYFDKLIKQVQQKHERSKQAILDQMVEIQRKKMVQTGEVQAYLKRFGLAKEMPGSQQKVNWQQVKARGVARQEQQCAICLTALWSRQVCLLSCSHMFHMACIQGFQRYALPGNKNKCPCCRSHYQKKLIQPLGDRKK